MKSNLGANIRNYRKNKGFTQEELAGMIGVTPQAARENMRAKTVI